MQSRKKISIVTQLRQTVNHHNLRNDRDTPVGAAWDGREKKKSCGDLERGNGNDSDVIRAARLFPAPILVEKHRLIVV